MRTSRLYYRVDRRCINMVRFIFEAYDGLAAVSTLDAATGLIVLSVAPGCEMIARDVLADLARHFMVESAREPGTETG